jgi:N-acetyl-1-D-myo-inositol-2-amino-2-deoxy-alpha-D-glucopyranoside deacetylase
VVRQGIEALRASGEDSGFAAMDPDDLPFACDDELVTTAIVAEEHADAKVAAMRAHATQISVEDGFFALSDNLGSKAMAVEYYRLVRGSVAGPLDDAGRETDLFAGLDL